MVEQRPWLRDEATTERDETRRGNQQPRPQPRPAERASGQLTGLRHRSPRGSLLSLRDNLALLCRRHHRTKTFSAWTYDTPQTGVYDWTSPTGSRFRVTRARRHGRMPITTQIHQIPPDSEP